MSLEGTIIGVDLDGVCSDFYGRMREIAAEWFERPLSDLTTDVSFELREWGIEKPDQYESLHRFAVTQRQLFETSPMIPGARLYLRKLSDEGARIRIVTHRLFIHYFHKGIVRLTLRPAQCRDEHSPAPLPSASLSARNHQPCRLALPQILHELPGC